MRSNLAISATQITAKSAAMPAVYTAKLGTPNLTVRGLPVNGTDPAAQEGSAG